MGQGMASSGLSMGLVFSTVMFVLGLALSLFSFYGIAEVDSSKFSFSVAVAGILFGGLFGLLLGLVMMKNHGIWYVVLASMVGFGVGGFGLGEALRRYLLSVKHANLETGNRFWLVLALFIFGLVGGAALGYIFSYLSEKTSPPKKTKWWHWGYCRSNCFVSACHHAPHFCCRFRCTDAPKCKSRFCFGFDNNRHALVAQRRSI